MPELRVKKLTALVHGCESGQHLDHPGLTCEQADKQIAHEEAFWRSAWGARYTAVLTPMKDVPAALRGPNWRP